jgi:hypothetical protein
MAPAILREAVRDERLLAMEREIARLSDKPLLLVYDPTIAATHNGAQKEYSDCILVTVAVDGPSQDYVIAHELAHTLRNQSDGSLQLDQERTNVPYRWAAVHIVSMLEHPSVIELVRGYGIEPDWVFASRARDVISALLNDPAFMSGEGNGGDCSDIATLVEYTGAFGGPHSQDFYDLYSRVRPQLVPRAAEVSKIVADYTSGTCDKINAAVKCAELMGAGFLASLFTVRSTPWEGTLRPRPPEQDPTD